MTESIKYKELWKDYFDERNIIQLNNGDRFCTYRAGTVGPNIVLLHGGGYSSMTWSLLAKSLRSHFTLYAIDFRGHGLTETSNDSDLSMETLVQDTIDVLNSILPKSADNEPPDQTIIIGHSLGGAVAVRVAATKLISAIKGILVLDVVEGTALSALEHMEVILSKRPQIFHSYKEAIAWYLRSGTIRNPDAATVSMPSQLVEKDGVLVWRTNLKASQPYWKDWFLGLSEQFLALPIAKILLLAGSDRLDTALCRGQMMGKFELRLCYGSGHVIQEDAPGMVAVAIVEFCHRNFQTPTSESVATIQQQFAGINAASSISSASSSMQNSATRSMTGQFPTGVAPGCSIPGGIVNKSLSLDEKLARARALIPPTVDKSDKSVILEEEEEDDEDEEYDM